MNGTMIGKLDKKSTSSLTPFKDLCASIRTARTMRSEYFNGLLRAWKGKDRLSQGKK